jgi:hypothetical protein
MAWVEMQKPDGKRLLLNLDLTFCFDEQPNGMAQAISINGVGAPTGTSYDTVKADLMQEESGP